MKPCLAFFDAVILFSFEHPGRLLAKKDSCLRAQPVYKVLWNGGGGRTTLEIARKDRQRVTLGHLWSPGCILWGLSEGLNTRGRSDQAGSKSTKYCIIQSDWGHFTVIYCKDISQAWGDFLVNKVFVDKPEDLSSVSRTHIIKLGIVVMLVFPALGK